MKLFAVVLCLVAVVAAAPPYGRYEDVALLSSYDNNGVTNYSYGFEQSDGTKIKQQGELKNEGFENEALVSRGSFSWVAPDGVTYTVTYVADENGYQPEVEQGPGAGIPPNVRASLLGG